MLLIVYLSLTDFDQEEDSISDTDSDVSSVIWDYCHCDSRSPEEEETFNPLFDHRWHSEPDDLGLAYFNFNFAGLVDKGNFYVFDKNLELIDMLIAVSS